MTPDELRQHAEGWIAAAKAPNGVVASRVNLERFANDVIDFTRGAEADDKLARLWFTKHVKNTKCLDTIGEFAEKAIINGLKHGVLQWKEALKTIAQLAHDRP